MISFIKFKPIFLFLFIMIIFSCATEETKTPTYKMWAQRVDDLSGYQLDVIERYNGAHCIVYVDSAFKNSCSEDDAMKIANEFDGIIYNEITGVFGSPPDVDQNGKIIIFILDILGNDQVAGFFYNLNEYTNKSLAKAGYSKISNEADLVFMDVEILKSDKDLFYTILAHEFQHMINFNQRVFVQEKTALNTWINEGLSTAAEKIYSNTKATERYTNNFGDTEVKNGLKFLSWDDSYYNYVTAYMFFQWARIQSGGTSIFKDIINNSASDYSAVENAIKNDVSYYGGTGNWETYMRDWLIASLNINTTGIWSYKNEISFTSPLYEGGTSLVSLKPGEGIIKAVTETKTLTSSGNIVYWGYDGTTTVTKDATTAGGYLVVFNKSGIPSEDEENTDSLPAGALTAATTNSNIISNSTSSSSSSKIRYIDAVKNIEMPK